jgi:hypothetical protein
MEIFLKERLLKRANDFRELGLMLLAINKFLTADYVRSDEIFPPSPAFIKTIEKGVKNRLSVFPKFSAVNDPSYIADPDPWFLSWEKVNHLEMIGVGTFFDRTRRKKENIKHFIQGAETAFDFYQKYHLSATSPWFFRGLEEWPENIRLFFVELERKSDSFSAYAHRLIGIMEERVASIRQKQKIAGNGNIEKVAWRAVAAKIYKREADKPNSKWATGKLSDVATWLKTAYERENDGNFQERSRRSFENLIREIRSLI